MCIPPGQSKGLQRGCGGAAVAGVPARIAFPPVSSAAFRAVFRGRGAFFPIKDRPLRAPLGLRAGQRPTANAFPFWVGGRWSKNAGNRCLSRSFDKICHFFRPFSWCFSHWICRDRIFCLNTAPPSKLRRWNSRDKKKVAKNRGHPLQRSPSLAFIQSSRLRPASSTGGATPTTGPGQG